MSNRLDPDQDRHYVGPDLGPNGLHRRTMAASSKKKLTSHKAINLLMGVTEMGAKESKSPVLLLN